MITTKQGLLMQGEFRQRLINGAYSIRAAGIYQLDKDYFMRSDGTTTPGYRDWRGSVESAGQFALTNKWVWGWDAVLLSDKTFLQDYNPHLSRYRVTDPLQTGAERRRLADLSRRQGQPQLFRRRSIYYYGFSKPTCRSRSRSSIR